MESAISRHFTSKRPVFGMVRTQQSTSKPKVMSTPIQSTEKNIQYTLDGVEGKDMAFKSKDDVILLHAIHSSVIYMYIESIYIHCSEETKKSIHLSDINSSVVFIRHVEGSVLAHRVTNSIIMVYCTQFRIHESENCFLSLIIPNHPVIEHCDHLTFSNMVEDVSENLDMDTSKWKGMENQYDQVRDFNWFQRTPSPHWNVSTMQSYIDIHEEVCVLLQRLRILTERK